MRSIRRLSLIVRLSVAAVFLTAIFIYLTYNNSNNNYHRKNEEESLQNKIVQEASPSVLALSDFWQFSSTVKMKFMKHVKHDKSTKSQQLPQYYNVWCIFTKVTSASPLQKKLKIFTESLLKFATVNVALHIICDVNSKKVASKIIKRISTSLGKPVKVEYYDVNKCVGEIEDIVIAMSPHFRSKPGTYYSDALFFLSIGLYRIAPLEQQKVVMIDVDVKFNRDIKELFDEFDGFEEQSLFGLAHELTPVYCHVLYAYRNKNPNTTFGEPSFSGGYPGYNSGVMLLHLQRLRDSLEYEQIISSDNVERMAQKYYFKGHLADQDFYTVLGVDRPEFIHQIDCGWNRQLCLWWKSRGYSEVFENYFRCDSETKLWHGNCNAPFPDDETILKP